MTREMGKPIREARMEARAAPRSFATSAGEACRPRGEAYQQSVSGGPVYTVRRPLGVVGADHALELPRRDPALEARPGADLRQHVVMKLAQEAPLTGLNIARALDDAGAASGCVERRDRVDRKRVRFRKREFNAQCFSAHPQDCSRSVPGVTSDT